MKILSILGSPRSVSNSTILAERFTDQAAALGAEVQTVTLNSLDYQGCQHCDGCRKDDMPCILEDDLTDVLDAVFDADVLLLSSPVYFGEVTAQMKGFIDRCRAFLQPDYKTNPVTGRLAPGKEFVFVLVQGDGNEKAYDDIHDRYWYFFKYFNFERSHLLRACGVHAVGEIEENPEILKAAENLARELVG